MRTVVYYFSGTGNTKFVCEGFARELRAYGHSVDLYPIAAGEKAPSPEGYDLVLVGYPVHAFNAPLPVLEFLKALPRAQKGVPVYFIRTSGEPLKFNDASGVLPRRILAKKGYDVKGEFGYVMPYNIIFKHSDGMASRMKLAAERNIPYDARLIASGGGRVCRVGPVRRLVSFTLRIEHAAMPLVGRRFKATEDCIGCGLCAKNCPQGNITMENGRPKFGKSCASCMGCAFFCPKDAVRTSMLNGWRVNGAYTFNAPPATDEEICRYCRKSYLRYFHTAESGK